MERFAQEGFDAFGQGKTRGENPYYLVDQLAAAAWSAGWLDGREMEEENKKVRLNRPVGRPKTITDMKAYKREKARQYRSEIKAGKRIPKKRG